MRALRRCVLTSLLLLLTIASPHGAQQAPTYTPHNLALSLRSSVQLVNRLKNAGIPAILHRVEGGHTINEGMVKLGKQWIEEVVRKGQ
jgi:hypothetical protein